VSRLTFRVFASELSVGAPYRRKNHRYFSFSITSSSMSPSEQRSPLLLVEEENSSILRLPILPATQSFNSVSGEGYPPGPISATLYDDTEY
jgi:hypothetical protein